MEGIIKFARMRLAMDLMAFCGVPLLPELFYEQYAEEVNPSCEPVYDDEDIWFFECDIDC